VTVTDELSVYWWHHAGALAVVAEGSLGAGSYGRLRDTLLKAAADTPSAVIVDLDRMDVASPVALALFPSVASKIAVWPGIPLILVVADEAKLHLLAEYRTRRYVPVQDSLEAAVPAIGDPPPRRVARIDLPYGSACFALTRDFVSEWCERWQVPESGRPTHARSPRRSSTTRPSTPRGHPASGWSCVAGCSRSPCTTTTRGRRAGSSPAEVRPRAPSTDW
jgi:hypothetical protein